MVNGTVVPVGLGQSLAVTPEASLRHAHPVHQHALPGLLCSVSLPLPRVLALHALAFTAAVALSSQAALLPPL